MVLMDSESARRSAAFVGLATLPIGAAILLAPERVGRALKFGDHPMALRAIGVADLALATAADARTILALRRSESRRP